MTDKIAGSEAESALWDVEALEKHWLVHLESLVSGKKTNLNLKRLRVQAEQDPSFKSVLSSWSGLDGDARQQAWKQLLECADKNKSDMLAACVQCGDCCRKGSPALMQDDLDILRAGKISWNQLITLRKGEPAHSPYSDEAFYLPEDRIKVREKPGSKECIFFDSDKDTCTIHVDRPTQCRAQACWDSSMATELAELPHLTRLELFKDVEVLVEMIEEHDKRCSFEGLSNAFDKLKKTKGQNIDEVLDYLGFEDHFRNFTKERLNIPEDNLELVFGRSLQERVRLFGFKVEISPDGTRTLLPE